MQTVRSLVVVGLALLVDLTAWGDALTDAKALWKFDYASNGFVTAASQVTDSSSNGHTASAMTNPGNTNISWATVPATGPGGASAVDSFGGQGRGVSLQPVLVTSGGTDTVSSVGFTVNNMSVTSSATIATRFMWDGYISDDSGAQMSWMYANGFGASNGWLFGIQNTGSNPQLKLFQLNFTTFDSGYIIQTGIWYDAVVVLKENIEEGTGTTDTCTFYLFPSGGSLLTTNLTGTIWTNSTTTTLIGNEAFGQGSGNQRKSFDGTVDYIGIWDRALTDPEAQSLIIPEPSSFTLLAGGCLALVAVLRRHRRG